MGQSSPVSRLPRSPSRFEESVQEKVGKLPLSGRYHRLPRRLEDDYAIEAIVLGSGYNGKVYKATSKSYQGEGASQRFAVKAFKLGAVAPGRRLDLESEVEIFLSMDHPHITRLFDVYECDEYLNLVMECMEGGELFDRLAEVKRFDELDACDTVWQMLLALNYLHQHGIVHRDIKLENFLFEKKDTSHLKLIDFGFSHMWDPNIKMHVSCGTLAYVAPEVLDKSYTSQCDLWSVGVITFILLSGYMPFSGSELKQTKDIAAGKYVIKPEKWRVVSPQAQHFTFSLLHVNPDKRLTAEAALEHEWMVRKGRRSQVEIDTGISEALRQFAQATRFRRCCMEMMAWSLSNEERAEVRDYFLAMDANKHGTITLAELRSVMVDKFDIHDEEVETIFRSMDTNNDEEIHYSDFLAAMVNTRIVMHDDLLKAAFKKFDSDASGYITVDNLREVLGNSFDGVEVEELLKEADYLKDNRISYAEFVSYIRGTPLDKHACVAGKLIDAELAKNPEETGCRIINLKHAVQKVATMLSIPERSRPREKRCCCIQWGCRAMAGAIDLWRRSQQRQRRT